MIISKIRICNFKSIYGVFELDFNTIHGFWKIEGPVGAGKTTIGEAIIFGLFGDVRGKNQKELISWGEKKGFVEIECISAGKMLNIHRDISSDLTVIVDGSPIVFTNKKDAQRQLEKEYYDISRLTIETLCIISFNNFKSLSNLNPKETRAFLDQIFGFSLLTECTDICKQEKKDTENKLYSIESKIYSIESQINKINQISNTAIIAGDLAITKEKISELSQKKSEENTKYQVWYNSQQDILRSKKDNLVKIKTLGVNKANEIKFIEQGTCPTCGAAIDQSTLTEKKNERKTLLEAYGNIKSDIELFEKLFNEQKEKFLENIKKYDIELSEYKSLKIKLEEQEKRNKINLSEIDNLKSEKTIEDKNLNSTKTDLQQWAQLQDFFANDMRQKILASFIPELNNAVQQYMSMLGLSYIVEFDEQFNCNIRLININRAVSISSLSTGQLKTVDMCIILGVLKVIFSKINFNIMFLDELFSNLDSNLRNDVCSILKNELRENSTVFIISHQEIDNEDFDGKIKVSLDYNDSKKKSSYSVKFYE
jgi:DNA repair exonuclease SbcCD ATPase subunit